MMKIGDNKAVKDNVRKPVEDLTARKITLYGNSRRLLKSWVKGSFLAELGRFTYTRQDCKSSNV